MPGQHSDNTKLLGFYADLSLAKQIDAARGPVARSQFLREAVVEYMVSKGVDVPESLIHPPDRAGKGGRKKSVVYKIARHKKLKSP